MQTDQLEARALDQCLQHARRKVMGDLTATVVGSRTYRDDFQMRQVFSQNLVLWRKYGRFDIIQDEAGILKGFVDHDKYREAGPVAPDRDVHPHAMLTPQNGRFSNDLPLSSPTNRIAYASTAGFQGIIDFPLDRFAVDGEQWSIDFRGYRFLWERGPMYPKVTRPKGKAFGAPAEKAQPPAGRIAPAGNARPAADDPPAKRKPWWRFWKQEK